MAQEMKAIVNVKHSMGREVPWQMFLSQCCVYLLVWYRIRLWTQPAQDKEG